jgi:broad specificity phosphatase PhoE
MTVAPSRHTPPDAPHRVPRIPTATRTTCVRAGSRGTRAALTAVVLLALGTGVADGALAARGGRPPHAPAANGPVSATEASTIVLVMRHAERANEPGPDPALSAAGAARAERLAEAARDAQVAAVFTTQFRRTRETAAPLARAAGVAVIERPVTAAEAAGYADALAREIRERHAGRTVAVVGHSNTVPAVVAALTQRPAPALADSDYGDVFVVVLPPAGGPARTLRLHVGG